MKTLFLRILSFTTCLFRTASLYEINPSLKFSEAIEKIPVARHFENLTLNHPLYTGLALGTLPLEHFMAIVQQDELFTRNYFAVFRVLADRENDPGRKQFLATIGLGNRDEYFQVFYNKFNFTAAKYMVPKVVDYAAYQMRAAKNWDLGSALATTLPFYTLWVKMGAIMNEMADLPNNPYHLYREFIEANSISQERQAFMAEFLGFVDGYYERLGPGNLSEKQQMLDAYAKSVEHEFFLAQTKSDLQLESMNSTQFSDLVKHVNKEMQLDVIRHNLFAHLGRGILPLDTFKVLIQQDHIYLRGFYVAFKIMEEKETDPERKKLLKKDGSYHYGFLSKLYKEYNFGETETTESYTSDYMDYLVSVARNGTVAEGLAAIYPCYLLWNRMGSYVNELADLPNHSGHPYYSFVAAQDPTNSTSLKRFNSLINGYFGRLDAMDVEMQNRMYENVHSGVLHEYLFATGIYQRSVLSSRY